MGKLIIFTNSYPYGKGYSWLDGELEACSKVFEKIVISPYAFEGNDKAKSIPWGIEVRTPVTRNEINFQLRKHLFELLGKHFFFYLQEFLNEKVYRKSYWFKSWISAILKTKELLKSDLYQYLKSIPGKSNTVLYFYWGNNQSLMIPFLKSLGFKKIVVRFHGFDLYKERLGGYQPFRRPLLKSITLAAPISSYGAQYLQKEYNDVRLNVKVLRLGVKNVGRSQKSEDGQLRIVSCARIIKLKRIDLIARVLGRLSRDIEWSHIGDGDYLQDVQKELADLPSNIRVNFQGWFPTGKVQEYYRDHPVDLFISLSSSEGIPVSIMEALSAGIPVFSTRVGGIEEIIDSKVGHLVEPNLTEEEYASQLEVFIKNYKAKGDVLRGAAYERSLKLCNENYWNNALVKELL